MHKKLIKRNPQMQAKVKTALALYQTDPQHSSLRLHKLTGTQFDDWSISVGRDIRIIFSYVSDGILLSAIGTHDEVY